MKIALASDLHLEFGKISLKNTEGARLLILSGDIIVSKYLFPKDKHGIVVDKRSEEFHEFFREVCHEFQDVIMVAGNHEHYHGDFNDTIPHMRKMLEEHTNLHIMDKEHMMIDGYEFIAGTLWTNMNKEDPYAIMTCKRQMNDYHVTTNSSNVVHKKVPTYKKDENGQYVKHQDGPMKGFLIENGFKFKEEPATFSPHDSIDDHKKFMQVIASRLKEGDHPVVVVGHHAPSFMSIHEHYKGDIALNGAYASDLSEFILDNPRIKLWTHGHTHNNFDYEIGSTRIVCNPRGYVGHDPQSKDFKLIYIEV